MYLSLSYKFSKGVLLHQCSVVGRETNSRKLYISIGSAYPVYALRYVSIFCPQRLSDELYITNQCMRLFVPWGKKFRAEKSVGVIGLTATQRGCIAHSRHIASATVTCPLPKSRLSPTTNSDYLARCIPFLRRE